MPWNWSITKLMVHSIVILYRDLFFFFFFFLCGHCLAEIFTLLFIPVKKNKEWLLWKLSNFRVEITYTVQKMKFSIKHFFSICEQIRSFLQIWSHLLKKSFLCSYSKASTMTTLLQKFTISRKTAVCSRSSRKTLVKRIWLNSGKVSLVVSTRRPQIIFANLKVH